MKGCRCEAAKLHYRKEAAGPGGRRLTCLHVPLILKGGGLSEASLYLLLGGAPEPLKLASTVV